jgi:hypothetical protein
MPGLTGLVHLSCAYDTGRVNLDKKLQIGIFEEQVIGLRSWSIIRPGMSCAHPLPAFGKFYPGILPRFPFTYWILSIRTSW